MTSEKSTSLVLFLKGNKRFSLVALISFLLFLGFLLQNGKLTDSRMISTLLVIILFLGLVGFLYYLAYRWVMPSIQNYKIHSWILFLTAGSMFGVAVGIWFVQSKSIAPSILTNINNVVPIFGSYTITGIERYFPLITILLFIFTFTFVFCVIYPLFKNLIHRTNWLDERKITLFAYALMVLSVTTCAFSTDAFQQGPGQKSIIFWGGTESYVTYRLEDTSLTFVEDIQEYGGFMHGLNSLNDLAVYESQTGFYSSILKLLQSVTQINADDLIKGTRVLLALLLAGMLTILSLALKRKYGWLASVIFSIFPVTIFWFLGPAGYLIWFYFILFIPFFVSIFVYPKVQEKKLSFKSFLWLIFAAEFLVFLRGYTYFPGLIASAAIPVFFYNLKDKKPFKGIFFNALFVCLVGLASLLMVLGIHFIQLGLYYKDWGKTFAYFDQRVLSRGSTGDTNLMTAGEIFQKWLTVQVFYLSPSFFAIFPQWQQAFALINNFGNLHIFAFILIGLSLLFKALEKPIARKSESRQKEINELFYLSLTTLVALVASWLWFPALGHMAHHYHMNGIMYMIPFGITLFIFSGVLVQTLIRWGVVGLKPDKFTQ